MQTIPESIWLQLQYRLEAIAPHGFINPIVAGIPVAGAIILVQGADTENALTTGSTAIIRELERLGVAPYVHGVLTGSREVLAVGQPRTCNLFWIPTPPITNAPGQDALDRAVANHAAKG